MINRRQGLEDFCVGGFFSYVALFGEIVESMDAFIHMDVAMTD